MMLHLELTMPNGDYLRLDTPDSELVGDWLKAIFHSSPVNPNGQRIPMEFRLKVY